MTPSNLALLEKNVQDCPSSKAPTIIGINEFPFLPFGGHDSDFNGI